VVGAVIFDEGCPNPHPVSATDVPWHALHGEGFFAFGQGEDEAHPAPFRGTAFEVSAHRDVDPADRDVVDGPCVYNTIFVSHQGGGKDLLAHVASFLSLDSLRDPALYVCVKDVFNGR